MLRAVLMTTVLATALTAVTVAQSRDRGNQRVGRPSDTSCGDDWSERRPSSCAVREATVSGGHPLEIDGRDVETHNGGVRMTLPEHYSAALETGTTNGRISIDFPVTVQGRITRYITTTLGAGGAKLRAITTNGGVSIKSK